MPDGSSASRPGPSGSAQDGVFINVEVDASVAGDTALAQKLEDACPVDIFAAEAAGVRVVHENLDECVLCGLCMDAAPVGTVAVTKLYDGTTLA